MIIDDEYGMIVSCEVGETVRDDLTGKDSAIIRIDHDKFGNTAIWLDNDYLDGGRHPWEIGPPQEYYKNKD